MRCAPGAAGGPAGRAIRPHAEWKLTPAPRATFPCAHTQDIAATIHAYDYLDDYLDDGTTGALVVGYAAAIWSTRRAALAGREADGREPAVSAPVPSQDDAG